MEMSNTHYKQQDTDLSAILTELKNDKQSLHVVIVNACRQGDASSLNVSTGISLNALKQYHQNKNRGKYVLYNDEFLNAICTKLTRHNNNPVGGSKRTKTIRKPKKTTKKTDQDTKTEGRKKK
jgi:hypothetical protein